jgi:hypothetical protein
VPVRGSARDGASLLPWWFNPGIMNGMVPLGDKKGTR